MPFTVYTRSTSTTQRLARDELLHWLHKAFETPDQLWEFHLAVDTTLPAFSWSLHESDAQIQVRGHDEACVLHAVYTLLEQVGYRFEITGARLLDEARLDNLRGLALTHQPAVCWRGIRQHLNFPMDISSYALAEAQEYLKNVARMRLNHITFHSYPGQWYEVPEAGEHPPLYAGNYFYGQRHDLPDHPIRQVIHNRQTFCIPEHESLLDDPAANSRAALTWLHALIQTAKAYGLRVQFSFELREQDLARSLATVESILTTYPEIDILEIITQESGDWGYAAPVDELRAIAAEYFPASLQDETITRHLIDGQKDLNRLMREIGHALQVFAALKALRNPLPALALGVYATVRSTHAVILRLLQRYAPPDVQFAFLLDHGNRAVAQNLADLNLPREDWERAMIYSWLEFDGTMYLQQNALRGIYDLIALGKKTYDGYPHPHPIHAMSFNHWRTAENQTCARYTAEVMLHGMQPPSLFYADYAQSYGIPLTNLYAEAMQIIDDADTQARNELPNVGFCYVGCWGTQGLGYFGVFKPQCLVAVRERYEHAESLLKTVLNATSNDSGRAYLTFLLNRLRCTGVYLAALNHAVALQPLIQGRLPSALSADEQAQVIAICNQALTDMEDYLALHAQHVPDRGCEGTLISFYYTPPMVLKRIRAEYGGTGDNISPIAHIPIFDAPPSPIWEVSSCD